ncbi:DUF1631 family protein [Hydrogenophaga sp.]|uniref:DUF1631 family protein n=1 Tax=Hydrogenophaga sp. TaxID=1904254 RepID=UPI00286E60A6|nr:DUF1631 family protein [Hydrogenophaga sp.]
MSDVLHSPQLIRSGVANDTGRLRPTLQHTLEAALSISDSMIDELLAGLAPVCDLDRPGPLPLGLELVDVARVERLIASADVLKRDWHQQLRQVLYHGPGGGDAPGQATVRFDDLRLLDDRQINASIEFATAEQALLAPAAEPLPRLNALVSNLMGWLTVQPDLNPLRPRAYATALRALMLRHVPDAQQRSALFVPMASLMGESLRLVYRELIQWLLAHGVEPLQASNVREASDQPPSRAVGRTLLTLGRLRQLLAGDLNAPAPGGPLFLQTVPASMAALEDLDMIEPLLQRLRQRPAHASGQSDGSTPAEPPELPVVSGQQLGRLLGQEVVRLMLEHLTHDERLLPAIRQQIGLLEPALIRLSQAEPRFFSDRLHPARQLLEALTQRSLGFQSHADEGFAELLHSLDVAVRSINRVQVSDETFARLLRRLRQRWEQDDARKQQRRADAARALMHAEQRQTLAERLAAEHRRRWQGKEVPEFVQRFLVEPWAQALAEAQLTPAPAGAAAQALDGVVDELIWSVQPALIRRDEDRLGRLVPRLVAQLHQGLDRIGYPAELTGTFVDALRALHEKAFDVPTLTRVPFVDLTEVVVPEASPAADMGTAQDDGSDPPAAVTAPAHALEPRPETFWIAGQAAEEAGFVDAASGPMPLEPLVPADLGPGAWVDLQVQGEWVRAQLTWTSPRGGLYMFISSRGLAHSMTRRTLDRLAGRDALRIVSTGGVVEHALDAVAQQALRNTRETPPGDN